MAQRQINIKGLPAGPLDAAAAFYQRELPEILDDGDILPQHDLVLVFEPAGPAHRGWRRAAVQDLARQYAPIRINALESDDEEAIVAALAYLDQAPGLTGQLLPLDGNGASALLY